MNDRMADGSHGNNYEACIIHLTAENKDRWNKLMAAAVLATGHRLYAFLDGILSQHLFIVDLHLARCRFVYIIWKCVH